MLKIGLSALLLIFLFSCEEAKKRNETKQVVTSSNETAPEPIPNIFLPDSVREQLMKNVHFDFSARRIKGSHAIDVDAVIRNNNKDTIYFLVESCGGLETMLKYNDSIFDLSNTIYCNTSTLITFKIPPMSKCSFSPTIHEKKWEKDLRLGYSFTLLKGEYYDWDYNIYLRRADFKTPLYYMLKNAETVKWVTRKIAN